MTAATGVMLAPPAAMGQAASRTVSRAELPVSLRRSLDDGRLARIVAGRVDTVADRESVTLTAGQVLATRTGDSAVVVRAPGHGPASGATDSVYRLPFEYLGLERDRAALTTYRPIYVPERRLQYRASDDRFTGSILIGLQEPARPSSESELTSAVRLRLTGNADSMVPDNVGLHRTNSQLERVLVFARNAQDSLRLHIVPTFDPTGVSVWLPVEPALVFEQTPAPIQGLGVETATLVIGTRGVSPRDSVVVTVSANKGGLATNRLVLTSGGGTVKLRSSGLGGAAMRASAPGFQTAETVVRFTWPTFFLLAALIGGAIGGVGAAYMATKRTSLRAMARYAARGLVLGFVVSVLYFGLGINLFGFGDIPFLNEIAVFALSILGGLFGLPALSAWWAQRKGA